MCLIDSLLVATTRSQKISPSVSVLQVMNEFLQRHGSREGGDYFLGGTYSAAETITTPFVRRMLLVLPALRDVDVDAILKEEGLDRIDRWFKVSMGTTCASGSGLHMIMTPNSSIHNWDPQSPAPFREPRLGQSDH